MTDLAVIIPCYNEALSITDTLTQLKPAIVKLNQIYGPLDVGIWVYNNNSTDNTVEKTIEWSCLNKDIVFLSISALNRVREMLSGRLLWKLMQKLIA